MRGSELPPLVGDRLDLDLFETDRPLASLMAQLADRDGSDVSLLLTWLDSHPLPVIAATNHARRLDPAALRRFVFKIDLAPLGAERAAQAFERFFGISSPSGIATLATLMPGDAEELLARLRVEAGWRQEGERIGF